MPFSFTVATTGYPAPKISKSGALPSGVTFADNGDGSATISGTPAKSAIGVYTLTLTAKSFAGTATQTFTLTITKAPVIKKIPTTTASVGAALSLTITASGSPAPALTESGSLPEGVTFTDNGNGTATIAGTACRRWRQVPDHRHRCQPARQQQPGLHPQRRPATSYHQPGQRHRDSRLRRSASPSPPPAIPRPG